MNDLPDNVPYPRDNEHDCHGAPQADQYIRDKLGDVCSFRHRIQKSSGRSKAHTRYTRISPETVPPRTISNIDLYSSRSSVGSNSPKTHHLDFLAGLHIQKKKPEDSAA